MPYDDYYSELNYTAEGTAVIPNRRKELQTYMQGLHYTDTAVKKFIQEIDKIDKPITFVFMVTIYPQSIVGMIRKNMD